jgi:hypothetical protein
VRASWWQGTALQRNKSFVSCRSYFFPIFSFDGFFFFNQPSLLPTLKVRPGESDLEGLQRKLSKLLSPPGIHFSFFHASPSLNEFVFSVHHLLTGVRAAWEVKELLAVWR